MYIITNVRLALAGQHPVELRAPHRERKTLQMTIFSEGPSETWLRH